MATVTVTGSGDIRYGYIVIDGLPVTAAGDYNVANGTSITMYESGTVVGGTVIVNGRTVESGFSGSYAYTVVGNCSIDMRVDILECVYTILELGGSVVGTHSALIDSTAYGTALGKTRIDETVREITFGKTLVDGTVYDINFGSDVIDPVEVLQSVTNLNVVGNNASSAKQLSITISSYISSGSYAYAINSDGTAFEIAKISADGSKSTLVSTGTTSSNEIKSSKGSIQTTLTSRGTLALCTSDSLEDLEELFSAATATVLANRDASSTGSVRVTKSSVAAGTILFSCRDTSYGFYLWDGSTLTTLFSQGSNGLRVSGNYLQVGTTTCYGAAIVQLAFDI